MRKVFVKPHLHSFMNPVPRLEEEEDIKLTVIGATCILLNNYYRYVHIP